MRLSENVFLIPHRNKLLLWDFENHKQFVLNSKYAERLLKYIYLKDQDIESANLEEIDRNLIHNKILTKSNDSQSVWGWDVLSRIFHLGTQDLPTRFAEMSSTEFTTCYREKNKGVTLSISEIDDEKESKISSRAIKLPPPDLEKLNTSFLSVLQNRRTVRDFNTGPIALNDIATLLYIAAGNSIEQKRNDSYTIGPRRFAPSAGNLHATNTWLISRNINGLDSAVYRYFPNLHLIDKVNDAPSENEMPRALQGQFYSRNSACSLILSTNFERLWTKYSHSRAYRIGLIELGGIIQNIQLTCSALSLSSWISGAMKDSFFNLLLGLDNQRESAMFFCSIGNSSGKVFPNEFEQ